MKYQKYFGGTGITLEALKKAKPTVNIDGTTYPIEEWLEECVKFDALRPGQDKLWIPYNVWERGVVKNVIWLKYNFKDYDWPVEMQDWWFYKPYAEVIRNGHDGEYYVYEISFYKKWPRKTQMNHLSAQGQKPKRKFLSPGDIREIKKQEIIKNK